MYLEKGSLRKSHLIKDINGSVTVVAFITGFISAVFLPRAGMGRRMTPFQQDHAASQ